MAATEEQRLEAAYLFSEGLNQQEVSKEVGISTRSLRLWLKDPEYKREIKRMKVLAKRGIPRRVPDGEEDPGESVGISDILKSSPVRNEEIRKLFERSKKTIAEHLVGTALGKGEGARRAGEMILGYCGIQRGDNDLAKQVDLSPQSIKLLQQAAVESGRALSIPMGPEPPEAEDPAA